MGDAEDALPPSKKRVAGRQISRENPDLDDEDTSEQETGTFKKASEEVLASRRILKVRRQPPSTVPSSNPFAGIRLVPPTAPTVTPPQVTATSVESGKLVSEEVEQNNGSKKETEKEEDENDNKLESETNNGNDENDKKLESKVDEAGADSTADKEIKDAVSEATKLQLADEGEIIENEAKTDTDDKKNENEERKDNDDLNVSKDGEAAPFSSFQQLSSSQNAFTGLVGSGFSSSTFSFGPISSNVPSFKNESSLFSSPGASIANKSEGNGIPSMQEVTVETGEENEKAVFTADAVLFEFIDGGWKERGKGELKINVSTAGTGKARLVMRARGNYRLILNASLYTDMKLAAMEKKGITFACMNSTGEGQEGLSTFALKFKDAAIVGEFRTIVTEHKGNKNATGLKTPENSP